VTMLLRPPGIERAAAHDVAPAAPFADNRV